MSEPIKPGDLVMLVHVCCEAMLGVSTWKLGVPRTVSAVQAGSSRCPYCGWHGTQVDVYCEDNYAPIHWLKRFPPLSELEGEKRNEEITA